MENPNYERASTESIEELQPRIELDASDAEAVKGGTTAGYNPKEISVEKVKWELSELDTLKKPR